MSGFIKWQPIDVTNAIAIAILMLLVGTVVSMYMSIAISRLSDFRKTRLAAMTEVSLMDRTLLGTRNYAVADIELRSALRVPAIAFRVDRQKEAVKFLEFAADALRTHFLNRFSELAAERGVRNCEELSGDEWANVVRAACRESECELRIIAEQVYQIKPAYWRVFMIPARVANRNRK